MHHIKPYFGQDFTSISVIKKGLVKPLYRKKGSYSISKKDIRNISLVISRYPDSSADNEFIKSLDLKIPVICHIHLRYNFLNSDQKRRLASSLKRCCLAITNSAFLENEYKKIFPNVIWLFVDNGVDPEIFKPSTEKERIYFKQKNIIPPERKIISYTGRLNDAKGFLILDIICSEASKSKDLFVAIQTIKIDKHNDRVRYLKAKYKNIKVFHEQDLKIARYCDICISTSLSETTSLTTLEALFCGIPVICTNVTKFYSQLYSFKAHFNFFNRINPPSRFKENTPTSKNNLSLSKAESVKVAKAFITKIRQMNQLSQLQREHLANQLTSSKFNINRMIKDLKKIYEKASLKS